jgi:hypothetical protein
MFKALSRRGVLAVAALTGLAVLCPLVQPLTGQEKKDALPMRAEVFVYPHKLTVKDRLTDGSSGKPIEIQGETTLIWVDLMPDARFAHATEYVLISASGTRVVRGQWRPVLNGKELFTQSTKPYQVDFPVKLTRK